MKHNIEVYQMTQDEKDDLIKRLTQDVTFLDEESIFETDEHFETNDDYETLEEVY